jgi:hypothetical protein
VLGLLQADAVLLVQSKEDAPAYSAALLKPQDAAELFHLEAAAAVVLAAAGLQACFLEPETLRLAAVRAQLAVHPGQAVAELAQVAAGLERVDFVRLLWLASEQPFEVVTPEAAPAAAWTVSAEPPLIDRFRPSRDLPRP